MAPDETKSEEPEEPQSSQESSSTDVTATFTLASPVPIQEKLYDAISDLSVRTQVQDCLHSMLVDVETTIYLQQQLELQANRQTLASLHKQHQATILEADAERLARDSNRADMADAMVREMMTLSQELESLLHWKQENLQKVQDYDELLAKLAQTEEELQAAQRAQYSGQPKPRVPESTTSDAAAAAAATGLESQEATTQPKESSPALVPAVPDDTLVTSSDLDSKPPAVSLDDDAGADADAAPETSTTTASGDTQPPQSEPVDSDAVLASTEATTETTPAAEVVALDEDEKEDAPPTLLTLDVEILMTIFGFMDAMDILNMAQINLEMYAKVDNIFGISEDGQSPPQPPAPAPAPVVAAPKPAPVPQQPTGPAPASAPAKSTPSASPSMGPIQAPTGPLGGRLLSMIQPARAGGGKKPAPGISATVAQAASKLSDAEVAAILAMTNRLTKAEKEVEQLRSEKETLLAKLDGTEAVKQFLINKVRDVELKLTLSRDDEIKVTNQIASDQEVIAFLDSRVQILERQTENLTKEKSRAMSDLESTTVQTSKKITMLSDMLKYEREKLKEEEGEWKATKKVLVKEVKSCRAQILALQAERDGLKEQNEMMKRAMLSTGRSATGVTSPR